MFPSELSVVVCIEYIKQPRTNYPFSTPTVNRSSLHFPTVLNSQRPSELSSSLSPPLPEGNLPLRVRFTQQRGMIAEFLEGGDAGKVRSGVVGLNGGNDEAGVEEATIGLALKRRRAAKDGDFLLGRQVGLVHFLGTAEREIGNKSLKRGSPSFAQTPLFRRGVRLTRTGNGIFVHAPGDGE